VRIFNQSFHDKETTMSKKWIAAMAMAAVIGACGTDDGGGTGPQQDQLVGVWVSAGANVAPGLVQLAGIDSIVATFSANQTYRVQQYSRTLGTLPDLTGTYQVGAGAVANVREISLTQTAPTALQARGIFQVTGNTMRYEVIQVEPNIGATAPTVAGGFGSTRLGGQATGQAWIQNYVRR
jgi:hypothetical protein